VLFVLSPFIAGEDVAIGPGVPGGAASRSDLPEGARAIVSPTDGFFYRRPSPDAEPFVEIGARIRPGQPLGLVEVMKTFNQILYGGPGLPDEAEILEFRAGDGAEVHAGQVLIVVR
jgi:acetyl-CoA carboxylase biotin carboxyl carrier protein